MSEIDKQPLRIAGVPEVFNDPFHYYVDSAEFVPTPSGSAAMLGILVNKRVDAAFMLTDCLVAAVNAGHSIKCASQLITSPLTWAIVVSHGSPKREEDLKHAVWGVSRHGSGSHLMARVLAARHGWPSPRFEICNTLDGLTAAVKDSKIDVFLWEKFTMKPLQRSGDVDIIGEIPTPWSAFCVAVRNDIPAYRLTQVRSVSDDFLIKADEWIRNPSTVEAIVQKHGMTHEDARAWIRSTEYSVPCQYRLSVEEIRKVIRGLLHSGVIQDKNPVPDEDLVEKYCF